MNGNQWIFKISVLHEEFNSTVRNTIPDTTVNVSPVCVLVSAKFLPFGYAFALAVKIINVHALRYPKARLSSTECNTIGRLTTEEFAKFLLFIIIVDHTDERFAKFKNHF